MNGQDLTKLCILIITDKINVKNVMHHQFFKNSYAPVYPCPLIVQGGAIVLGGAVVRSSENSSFRLDLLHSCR